MALLFLIFPQKHVVDIHYKRLAEALLMSMVNVQKFCTQSVRQNDISNSADLDQT